MVAPVLIFAVGNESRGDDALGPLLLRELDVWLTGSGLSDQVDLLEDFQLQVEHALDMQGRQLVLFVDAGMDTAVPYAFYRVQPDAAPVLYSHALAPEALLEVYEQFYREAPPAVFVLCIRGERFELGEGLSPQAAERLMLASEFGKKLLFAPEIGLWDARCIPESVEKSMAREDNHPGQAVCEITE